MQTVTHEWINSETGKPFSQGELMEPQEVSDFLGVSMGTLSNWRSRRLHMAFLKHRLNQRVMYPRAVVEAFKDQRAEAAKTVTLVEPRAPSFREAANA